MSKIIYYLLLLVAASAYFAASKYIFDKVYDTIDIVIDELFHIPQGLAFCNRNFTYWDPKITTLPGLYLVTSAVLGTYVPCNTYNLRFVNLVASVVNLFLFASILKFVYGANNYVKTVTQAVNLSLLPPLYFFSHVYYTDTLALTFLLLYSRMCFTNKYKLLILFYGLSSVLMRQTNIVWVAMVFAHKLLDLIIKSSRVYVKENLTKLKFGKYSNISQEDDASKLKRYYGITDLFSAIRYHTTHFSTIFKYMTFQDWLIFSTHLVILLTFASFVIVNGSIVVGDKKAHEAALHIPQVLYFLLFYGVFGLPFVLAKLPSTLKLMFHNKLKVIALIIVINLIVHYNTVVHPYLLADNRHYTFYIWNRWFGKYNYAKYATTPAYVFLLFSLYDNLAYQNCISFLLPYSFCIFIVLSLQRMIEIRYFLVPYIILRLRFVRATSFMVFLEFIWYLFLNAITFNLFFNIEIVWKDFDYVQRLIW